MNRLACLAAIRTILRFCGVLLVTLALAAPFAFAGVNRWTTSAVQTVDRWFEAPGWDAQPSLAVKEE
jgi:hypothetical protein